MENAIGTLYLVGTPIGNLEDMTFRAVKILSQVDFVYCEDTRRTQILIQNFKIQLKNGLKSFHDHSSQKVVMQIKKSLNEGKSIAYVTDAGMPLVSDPGFVLVREAYRIGAKVEAIPGASAVITLFCLSGLESNKFLFHGFFPVTFGEIEKVIEQIKNQKLAHIFYESPARFVKTLKILEKNFSQNQIVVGRELTKMHEEIKRGSVGEVLKYFESQQKIRGEITFALLGGGEKELESTQSQESHDNPTQLTEEQKKEITALIKSGLSSKDTAKLLSKKFKLSRKIIYDYIVKSLT
jgi:16S rRNA (cytidine1402-2'-O)-methyltransferase